LPLSLRGPGDWDCLFLESHPDTYWLAPLALVHLSGVSEIGPEDSFYKSFSAPSQALPAQAAID
jgi:hypothetical protein